MPTEYAGVLAIPLIIGLVEAAKRVGLDTAWATPLAIVLGLAVSLGYVAAQQVPGSEVWLDAVTRRPVQSEPTGHDFSPGESGVYAAAS